MQSILDKNSSDTDICLFQEVPFYSIRNLPSFESTEGTPFVSTSIHGNWVLVHQYERFKSTQVAIYVNKRVLQTFSLFLLATAFNDPNIICIRLTENSTDRSASIVNVYNNKSSKMASHSNTMQRLITNLNKIQDLTFLKGDFNLHHQEWDNVPTNDTDGEALLQEAFLNDLTLLNNEYEPTWFHKTSRNSVLDLAFMKQGTNTSLPAEITIDTNRGPGDHAILRVKPSSTINEEEKFAIASGSEDEKKFIQEVSATLTRSFQNLNDAAQIESEVERFAKEVEETWQRIATKKTINPNANKWWNEECCKAEKDFNIDRSKDNKKKLATAIKKAKRTYFGQKLQKMSDMGEPWEGVSWTRERRLPAYTSIERDGKPVGSITELWDVFHEQFSKQATAMVDWDFIGKLPKKPKRNWHPISDNEIDTNLKSTKNNSAPGPDKITWRIWKRVIDANSIKSVNNLFNAIMKLHHWPSALKQAQTVVIPKPNKTDYSLPKAYRPIALLNTLGKLLTKILAQRLQFDAAKFKLTHQAQFGGIQKHSTVDAGLVLTDIIAEERLSGNATTCLALDIAQFFPSMNHLVLAKILDGFGFPDEVVNTLTDFFRNRKTTYKWGSAESDKFDFNVGVPQGDCLSPILSALYIAPILTLFLEWNNNRKTNVMFYVDDGTIITSSTSLALNCDRLASKYAEIKALFGKIGIKLEDDKLELQHFYAYKKNANGRRELDRVALPPITIEGKQITAKTVWRYLGFFFDSDLSFSTHISNYINKSFSALRACRMLGSSIGGLDSQMRVLIYKTCVIPIMLYGSQLWWRDNGKGIKNVERRLNTVQNHALRWITGAFRTTPISALILIADINPIRVHIDRSVQRAAVRLAKLPHTHLLRKRALDTSLRSNNKRTPAIAKRNPLRSQQWRTTVVEEHFDVLHDEVRPGTRVTDIYSDRISIENFRHPKKDDDDFPKFVQALRQEILKWRQNNTIIASDGSLKKNKGNSCTSAFVVFEKEGEVHRESRPTAGCSSYEAEIQAIEMGIEYMFLNNVQGRVTFLVDNEAAARDILVTKAHPMQMASIRSCSLLRNWFSSNSSNQLRISWCPSHCGIEENTAADKAANALHDPQARIAFSGFMTSSKVLQAIEQKSQKEAAVDFKVPGQWLNVRIKGKKLAMNMVQRHKKIRNIVGTDIVTFSRFTRAITGHAPTGEYRARFHPGTNTKCTHHEPPFPLHSRDHIFWACGKYPKLIDSFSFHRDKDSLAKLAHFLKEAPGAFSFEDAPADVH